MNELNIYAFIIILGLGLIIYQIHKYGLRGYLDGKLERRKRRYNMFYDTVQKIHI